jgi:hypothetical protein
MLRSGLNLSQNHLAATQLDASEMGDEEFDAQIPRKLAKSPPLNQTLPVAVVRCAH